MTTPIVVQIVVDKPLPQGFDYLWDEARLGCLPQIGHIVEIPFGRGKEVGIVTKVSAHSEYEFDKLRSIEKIAPLPLLDGALLKLMNFASQYYVHALGETIMPSIPKMWRKSEDWDKIPKKLESAAKKKAKEKNGEFVEGYITADQLNQEQSNALESLIGETNKQKNGFRAILMQGQTGSGKTAVFLNWLASILQDETAQVLLLVPEINLTPQLERRVRAYFPNEILAVLHSGVTEK